MFWVQLSTFVLFNLLILALLATQPPLGGLRFAAGQHAGAGDGEYTVWHLIADIEAERAEARGAGQRNVPARELPEIPPQFPRTDPDRPTGRHHLRADRELLCGDPQLLLGTHD
ncbi:hypothetical protein F1721_14005 [Saccharopolyspora hirsuta]|uniref:Uncharacterized protein n=1 Tax=Saccharopolyspora hirsuta TaxID=1837 RepID=A0A5M7C1J7_SACHI|nr:hypothetical protein F1721_14005 [Saccharopolyspora hirsuta]